MAHLPSRKLRSRLPDLPLRGHGSGKQRRRLGGQRRQGPIPSARLHGLPPLRGVRQGTGGPSLHWPGNQAAGAGEEGQSEASRRFHGASRQGGDERGSQSLERSCRRAEGREQQSGSSHHATRPDDQELVPGHEEGRAQSQGCAPETEQELDSCLAEQAHRFSAYHEDAELPLERRAGQGHLGLCLAIGTD